MLKLFTQTASLRQFEKISTNIDQQKFVSVIHTFSKQINKKCFSQESAQVSPKTVTFVPFLEKIEQRKAEARRSIIVQVQSEQSCSELHAYCSSVGTVNNMFHYSMGIEPSHYIIVEFADESDSKKILNASTYNGEDVGLPTYSHFLWFRAANRKLPKLKQTKGKLDSKNSTNLLEENTLKELLLHCTDISDQMMTLYRQTKLNDVGTRLRFLTAMQIESCLIGMFPNCGVFPFGSSVNGFGKMTCDLDLVLRFNSKKHSDKSRLVFHCKASSILERSTTQKYMESFGDIISLFLPGCTQVRRILQARVPIIKFRHQFTDVECDLSMSNMSGVYMSDFLYMMGELDERVRPLVFVVRSWAKAVGLTHSSPGRWITNFSLSLLVLAFLQNPLRSPPILPSLNTLVKLSGPTDKYVTEDGIDCTFLRDLNKYQTQTENTESLESLLKEFFEYYLSFDFSGKAVCLNEGVPITKPEFQSMYIVNPLEKGLNVSRNVSLEEVDKFKRELKNALWTLESQENKNTWGILGLLENSQKTININFHPPPKQNRLMDLTTLFQEEELQIPTEYKNPEIKKRVEEIKKHSKEQIKKMNTKR